jgi:hypothetical protein
VPPYARDPVGQISQDRPNKPNCRSLGHYRDRIGAASASGDGEVFNNPMRKTMEIANDLNDAKYY